MDNRERVLIRLDALKKAVKEADLPDEALAAIYLQLNSLDDVFAPGTKTHSIMELEGLGKEFWRSVDVEKYLKEERESWR